MSTYDKYIRYFLASGFTMHEALDYTMGVLQGKYNLRYDGFYLLHDRGYNYYVVNRGKRYECDFIPSLIELIDDGINHDAIDWHADDDEQEYAFKESMLSRKDDCKMRPMPIGIFTMKASKSDFLDADLASLVCRNQ